MRTTTISTSATSTMTTSKIITTSCTNRLLQLKNIGLDDDLILQGEWFNFQYCDLLAQLFANIEHLVVYVSTPDHCLWRPVPYLLKLWPNLTSLSLHGYCESLGIVNRIFLAIDSLYSLTSLDISLHNDIICNEVGRKRKESRHRSSFMIVTEDNTDEHDHSQSSPPSSSTPIKQPLLDLPQILPQLEQLSISLFKYKTGDLKSVIQQLSSVKFRRLSIEWEAMTFEQFREAFLTPPSSQVVINNENNSNDNNTTTFTKTSKPLKLQQQQQSKHQLEETMGQNLHQYLYQQMMPSRTMMLAANITELTLRCVKGSDYIPFISNNFHSLQYLSLLYSSLTMVSVRKKINKKNNFFIIFSTVQLVQIKFSFPDFKV